jgi:hypothetical protein
VSDCFFAFNTSRGGAAGPGGTAGDGEGGGLLCDGSGKITVQASLVAFNDAIGGRGPAGADGDGEGGGLYVVPGGTVCIDSDTFIVRNRASTRDDNVSGLVTVC